MCSSDLGRWAVSFQILGQLRGFERQNVKGQPVMKMEFDKISSTCKLFCSFFFFFFKFAVHAVEALDYKV